MTTIQEGSISIQIPDGCIALRFDGHGHGLSHCMKAVDFLIETPRALIFLELKDPESGPPARRQEWIERLQSGKIDSELKTKFRDTWLYLYGTASLTKPVIFLVLIGLGTLSSDALAARTTYLKKQLPFEGPSGPWTQELVSACAVHNLESWNRNFAQFQAEKV